MPEPNVKSQRTPDFQFSDLPNFPYKPQYLHYGNLRMAYIDEGASTADETFLCLHGQPTWSYLYRKMIPVLLSHTTNPKSHSRRVLAPDLFGFGRSDKPTDEATYTYNFHRDSLLHFIRSLNLRNITLVVQDWGGLLGLTLPLAEPGRFKRLIVMNTTLATGESAGKGFNDWRAYNNANPDLQIGKLISRGASFLSKEESAAYDSPYPDVSYKVGVRQFPNLVMTSPDMEGADISKQAMEFFQTNDVFGAKDVFMAVGMKDPVLGPKVMEKLSAVWKRGCWWTEVPEAGHFVQEWGEVVARKAIETFEKGEAVEGVRRVEGAKSRL